jgi:DNA-binding PadR family transcriptional regulator
MVNRMALPLPFEEQPERTVYTITDKGREHLEENRDFVDAVLGRLAALGEKFARMRRRFEGEEREGRRGPAVPPLVRAALDNLREVAAKRLEDDAEAEAKIVDILARAAAER